MHEIFKICIICIYIIFNEINPVINNTLTYKNKLFNISLLLKGKYDKTASEFDIIKSVVKSELRISQKIRDNEFIPADSTKVFLELSNDIFIFNQSSNKL